MLVADPSSACDICVSTFNEETECYCIPCGHVFCQSCLSRLPPNRLLCPICRTHLNSRSRIRKIIVDWGTGRSSSGHNGNQPARAERDLEEELAREYRAEGSLTLARALELQQKVIELMDQVPNENPVLKSFASALCELADVKQQKARVESEKLNSELGRYYLERKLRDIMKEKRRAESMVDYLFPKAKKLEATSNLRESHLPQQPPARASPSPPPLPPDPWRTLEAPQPMGKYAKVQNVPQGYNRQMHHHHAVPSPVPDHSPTPPQFSLLPTHRPHGVVPEFPPPPPLSTMHVPAPPGMDVWSNPRRTNTVAGERSVREREVQQLSYQVIYQEQMRSREVRRVSLPPERDVSPAPDAYDAWARSGPVRFDL